MPWILIDGALRRLRESRKLDRVAAAKKSGLDVRTLERHELSDPRARILRPFSVQLYAHGYDCEPTAFASWIDKPGDAIHIGDVSDEANRATTTLFERAERELEVSTPRTLTIGARAYPVVSNLVLQSCMTDWERKRGAAFVVEGTVGDVDYLDTKTARLLDANEGAAARFCVERFAADGLLVNATVFTRRLLHTEYLLSRKTERKHATLMVRLVARSPKNSWPGFTIYENNPVPRPWIFLVDGLVLRDSESDREKPSAGW